MSISNIVSENDTLLVSQVDAESANIGGLINCIDLTSTNNVTCENLIVNGSISGPGANIETGSFTPIYGTLTNISNITSEIGYYTRTNNHVQVFVAFVCTVTDAGSGDVVMRLDNLPVAKASSFSLTDRPIGIAVVEETRDSGSISFTFADQVEVRIVGVTPNVGTQLTYQFIYTTN